jgi:hypothetical protein
MENDRVIFELKLEKNSRNLIFSFWENEKFFSLLSMIFLKENLNSFLIEEKEDRIILYKINDYFINMKIQKKEECCLHLNSLNNNKWIENE